MQVRRAFALVWRLCGNVGYLEHRKPASPAGHAAFIRHDREKPGPERWGIAPQLAQLGPGLDRGFLDGILRRSPIAQLTGGQPVYRVELHRAGRVAGIAVYTGRPTWD